MINDKKNIRTFIKHYITYYIQVNDSRSKVIWWIYESGMSVVVNGSYSLHVFTIK